MSGTSLANQLDTTNSLKRPRSSDSKNEVYVRKIYVRKPHVRVEPIVTHSKPQEIAGHVYRRENRVAAALQPPSSKPKLADRGAGGNREQEERETEEQNKNNEDEDEDDDGDDNEEGDNDEQRGEAQQSDLESDDDFASATSSPWPEEIWKDAPNDEVLAALERHKRAAPEEKAKKKRELEFRKRHNLEGPGWRISMSTMWGTSIYQLFSKGDQVGTWCRNLRNRVGGYITRQEASKQWPQCLLG